MNLFDLTGKTILLTGGAGHLGSAMAEALVAYNAEVFIASRDEEKCINLSNELNRKYNGHSHGLSLDISKTESIKNCIEEILKTSEKIDVLINNAAFSVSGFFENLTEDSWKLALDGTINSVFRMCHEVLPFMEKRKSGNIINIASMYGIVSPVPETYQNNEKFNNPACYGAGKAAIIQLTKYLAGYYGEKGIRCNSISPGPFPSKTVQKTDWFIENLSNRTMLKRIGHPEELAGAIVFLSSNASSYITGTNLCIDGGWTAW